MVMPAWWTASSAASRRPWATRPRVIATGGLACLIASETKSIDAVDDYLTLKGLKIIYERNRPRREERVKGGRMSQAETGIGRRYLEETRYHAAGHGGKDPGLSPGPPL